MSSQVIVVGCGVIGLTSAICLQEHGFDVTVITRDLPPNVTSAVAGAMWYGNVPLGSHLQQWAAVSLDEYLRLAAVDNSGVSLVKVLEVFVFGENNIDSWFKDRLPYFHVLAKPEVPYGYNSGYIGEVPMIETPHYLAYLINRFQRQGGHIEQRTITTLAELVNDHPFIVNCTGVWARYVANDSGVYPLWGQVVKVNVPHIQQGFMDDYHFTYIYPRPDGCILGGIVQKDNWSPDVDPAVTEDILRRCEVIEPSVRQADIIVQLVGLRPGRQEVRLEPEIISHNCTIIHNYGHGGLGFTLSWGCGQEVAELAQQIVGKRHDS